MLARRTCPPEQGGIPLVKIQDHDWLLAKLKVERKTYSAYCNLNENERAKQLDVRKE